MEKKFKFPVQVTQTNQNERRLKAILKNTKSKTGNKPRLTNHNRKG